MDGELSFFLKIFFSIWKQRKLQNIFCNSIECLEKHSHYDEISQLRNNLLLYFYPHKQSHLFSLIVIIVCITHQRIKVFFFFASIVTFLKLRTKKEVTNDKQILIDADKHYFVIYKSRHFPMTSLFFRCMHF